MNIIRRRSKHRRHPPPPPFVSRRPWVGFSARDMAREEPLARCPSARCRRAKACLAAVDNLYCLRTHFSLDEQARRHRQSPLQRELDSVPAVADEGDLTARMERIAELAAIRRAHDAAMLARWQAGALDHLHGKYRKGGVVLAPPAKAYAELPAGSCANGGGQGGARHV